MSRRTDRVSDVLRAELSDLLLREVHDPRVKLASVTSRGSRWRRTSHCSEPGD